MLMRRSPKHAPFDKGYQKLGSPVKMCGYEHVCGLNIASICNCAIF